MLPSFFKKYVSCLVLVVYLIQLFCPAFLWAMKEDDPFYYYSLRVINTQTDPALELSRSSPETKDQFEEIFSTAHPEKILIQEKQQEDPLLNLFLKNSLIPVDNGVVWNIPGFATINVDKEGTTYLDGTVLGEEIPSKNFLSSCHLTLETSQALILNSFHIKNLHLKSKNNKIKSNVSVDCLTVDHLLINKGESFDQFNIKGGLHVNRLLGTGTFINKGHWVLEGKDAELGIDKIQNNGELKGSTLVLKPTTQSFLNGKKGRVSVTDVILENTTEKSLLNKGYWHSHTVQGTHFFNAEFACLEILDTMKVQSFVNQGDVSIKTFLQVTTGENGGKMSTPVIQVPYVFRNKGQMKLQSIIGLGKFVNNKELIFLQPHATHLSLNIKTFENTSDLKTQGKFIKKSGKMINKGTWEHEGDIDLGKGELTNQGKLIWRNGHVTFEKQSIYNYTDWLFHTMTGTDPMTICNWGTMEFEESALTFGRLVNSNNVLFRSGQYRIFNGFQNKLLTLLDTDWILTDNTTCEASNRIVFTGSASKDLGGEIESEKSLTYDLYTIPKEIRSQADVLFTEKYTKERKFSDLKNIKAVGKVKFFYPALKMEEDYECPFSFLDLYVLGDFINYFSFKAPRLNLTVKGKVILGENNNKMGTLGTTAGALLVMSGEGFDARYGKVSGVGGVHIRNKKNPITLGASQTGVDHPEMIQKAAQDYCPLNPHRPSINNVLLNAQNNFINWGNSSCSKTNGAYIVSKGKIFLVCEEDDVYLDFASVFGENGCYFKTPKLLRAIASKILSGGLTYITCHDFQLKVKDPVYYSYSSGTDYIQGPGSGPSIVNSVGNIYLYVKNKVLNRGSSFLTQGDLIINDCIFNEKEKPSSYTEETVSFIQAWFNHHGRGCDWGQKGRYYFTQSPSIHTSGTVHFNLGDCIITGNTTSGDIKIDLLGKAKFNGSHLKYRQPVKETIVFNLNTFLENQAPSSGILELTEKKDVICPLMTGQTLNFDQMGRLDFGQNESFLPNLQLPNSLGRLPKSLLNLFAQQKYSDLAYHLPTLKEMNGMQLIDYLVGNGQQQAQRMLQPLQVKDVQKASLLCAPQKVGNSLQLNTFIVIPKEEVNATEGIVAKNKLKIHSGDDHTNVGMNMVGGSEVEILSEGRIETVAPVETHVYDSHGSFYQTVKDTKVECLNGPLTYVSKKEFSTKGIDMGGQDDVIVGSTEGSTHISTQQLIHRHMDVEEKDGGIFGGSKTITTETVSTTSKPSTVTSKQSTVTLLSGQDKTSLLIGSQVTSPQEIILEGGNFQSEASVNSICQTVTKESENLFSSSSEKKYHKNIHFTPSLLNAPKITVRTQTAQFKGTDFICCILEDYTKDGAGFAPTTAWEEYFHQYTSDSPFLKMDVGCEGGREVMQPCRMAINQIIRHLDSGEIKFQSVEWQDKSKVKFLCNFSESVYHLKSHHREWKNIDQLISDEALVVAGLALSMVTQGWGTALFGSSFFGSMASVGFASLCGHMGNQYLKYGDPFKAVESAFSEPALKSYLIAMGSAGLTKGIGEGLGINLTPGSKGFFGHLQEQLLKVGSHIALECTIGGQKLSEILPKSLKKVSIHTIAASLSNQVVEYCGHDESLNLALETGIGSGMGFALEGNREGLLSGCVSVLAAQLMAKTLLSESQDIVQKAHDSLKDEKLDFTDENLQKALYGEIKKKTDLALLGSSAITLGLGLKPPIGIETATNTLDNNVTVRELAYLIPELQALIIKTSQALAQYRPQLIPLSEKREIKKREKTKTPKKSPRKQSVYSTEESRDLNLHLINHSLYSNQVPLEWYFPDESETLTPSKHPVEQRIESEFPSLMKIVNHQRVALEIFTDLRDEHMTAAHNPKASWYEKIWAFIQQSAMEFHMTEQAEGLRWLQVYPFGKDMVRTGKGILSDVVNNRPTQEQINQLLYSAEALMLPQMTGTILGKGFSYGKKWFRRAFRSQPYNPNDPILPYEKGGIETIITSEDQFFYRVFTSNRKGNFLMEKPPSSRLFVRNAYSLPSQNKATYIQGVFVPEGIELTRSRARGAFGKKGGGVQYEVKKQDHLEKLIFMQEERLPYLPRVISSRSLLGRTLSKWRERHLEPIYNLKKSDIVPFVFDPKGGEWNKAHVSGILELQLFPDGLDNNFHGLGSKFRNDYRAWHVVHAHGNADFIQLERNPHAGAVSFFDRAILKIRGNVLLTPQKLKRVVLTDPNYTSGRPIMLWSCLVGNDDVDGFAKKFQKIMGVPVIAPNKIIWHNDALFKVADVSKPVMFFEYGELVKYNSGITGRTVVREPEKIKVIHQPPLDPKFVYFHNINPTKGGWTLPEDMFYKKVISLQPNQVLKKAVKHWNQTEHAPVVIHGEFAPSGGIILKTRRLSGNTWEEANIAVNHRIFNKWLMKKGVHKDDRVFLLTPESNQSFSNHLANKRGNWVFFPEGTMDMSLEGGVRVLDPEGYIGKVNGCTNAGVIPDSLKIPSPYTFLFNKKEEK